MPPPAAALKRWWYWVDFAGAGAHFCGWVALAILIGTHEVSPRPAFLFAMEFISFLFHVAYCSAKDWRDKAPPNRAKWLEYSLTAALGVLALLPPSTFPTCDAYAATLVGVVSAGVLQQQAGKRLDIAGYEGGDFKSQAWQIRGMFWGAVAWQAVEIALVWEFSNVAGVGSRLLVLLPYLVFYPAFGVLCFFRLWAVRPRRYNFLAGGSTPDPGGVEPDVTRYRFEGLYSLLGTVAKITLLTTTCIDLYGPLAYAQLSGLLSTVLGVAVLAWGLVYCF